MTALERIARTVWDVIVVGAGPAGSLAARQLAHRGARVLLVDRTPLGRWKVCGCCLNQAALATLYEVDLANLPTSHGAIPLQKFQVATRRSLASVPVPGGVSLSRQRFDAALIREAIAVGTTYLAETNASLGQASGDCRQLILTHANQSLTARARVVLAADGLGGRLLARSGHLPGDASRYSKIGAGIVLSKCPDWVEPGSIYMATSRSGYVGLVRLEDGQLNVAAAFERDAVRRAGSPGQLAGEIVSAVGWHEMDGLTDGSWRGTMALTTQPTRLWDERVLVVGDAAGYVEPFTGEGMAWALASAVAVTPFALQAIASWDTKIGQEWHCTHRQLIGHRQATCRTLAHALRHPWLVGAAIRLLRRHPVLAQPVMRRINAILR